jgi:hypothetical protein
MKKIIYLFTFVLLTVLYFSSCKVRKTGTISVKFSEEALSYVQIPVNSYFIYEESNGLLDSIVVSKSELENKISTINYQNLRLTLVDYTSIPRIWFDAIATLPPSPYNFYIDTLQELSLIEKTDNVVFKYPLINQGYGLDSVYFLQSLQLKGRMFTNVIVYITTNAADSTDPTYRKSSYYWAKSVGIIKKEIITFNSQTTFTLLRNG